MGGPPADGGHGSRTWSSAAWREEAVAWVDERLAEHRTTRTGDVAQPRVRPWSTQLVVPTDRGRVWFKAAAPGLAHEPALLVVLARLLPRRVREPLAVDTVRGWSLLRDEGPRLDEEPVGLATWCELLRDAATLQRATVAASDALLAAGLPDLRAERLPGVLDDLLHRLSALPHDHPSHLDADGLARIDAGLPAWRDALARLREPSLPAVLQHGDLHPGNVFARREPGAPWRIFDFGDASLAHPLEVLVVPRRLVTDEHGTAAAEEVTDAYLEVWDDLVPRADLRTLVAPASRVHLVARALTWWRSTQVLEPDEVRAWGGSTRLVLDGLAETTPA